MPLSHSVYAVYGVVVAPPRDREALEKALDAQAHHPVSGDPADAHMQLFTVGDVEHTVLGAGYERLGPNTCRAVPSLPVRAEWDDALLEQVRNVGLTVRSVLAHRARPELRPGPVDCATALRSTAGSRLEAAFSQVGRYLALHPKDTII
ncbi:hypothetical protein ACIPSA_51070 [Streptomyces sp. NPDC086549]|uniref:hypothetical protein n=1 Tax=Streptomyces sp. NPDC086549 TaxID=3365752 RepID=UPI0037FF03F7